ncbi:3-dehydroquinate synthase [Bacillus solimangrovi]|uniref:3-dehydroquinate synthase n=1 Tax=Bacillus solimangrovi TaxID=1305675 RepID=A0A1E5LH97_9BACI|nr:3-dehydroquinate synthase [Bacillus solimangrovi]OEH93451.1 3-dehydroquinate synthase [Bacillus solimangrovi]
MEKLQIETTSKSYEVLIGSGLHTNVAHYVQKLGKFSSVFVISDEAVAPLYLENVKQSVSPIGTVHTCVVPKGETAKSFDTYYYCQTKMLEVGCDRNTLVLALGGGAVGDLAGFVAATYMRGVPFVQMPTTLLAHDSSVGGKTAINHPLGKNMIGAFYQPEAVLYDIDLLNSLPESEWRSGFAEVIKHALIWDEPFYKWLKENISSLQDLRKEKLTYALKKGISVKAAVVKEDERELGIRAYLNFGHTLAHAIEALAGYGKVTHGDAVAIGMLFAIRVSEAYYEKDLGYESFAKWFAQYGYPTYPTNYDSETLMSYMKKDKKAQFGNLRMVLMKEIGAVETVQLSDEFVLERLNEVFGGGKID